MEFEWKKKILHGDHREDVPSASGVYTILVDPQIARHPGTSYEFRNKNGGHLLFRPIGLLIISKAVEKLSRNIMSRETAIDSISQLPMYLNVEPWMNLLWDPRSKRMIYPPENQKAAEKIMFYLATGDLSEYRTSFEELKTEYAGILNREPEDINLEKYRIK